MCVFVRFSLQSGLLSLLDGKVWCCMFEVAMCVVCFKWQTELLVLLGGSVCCTFLLAK